MNNNELKKSTLGHTRNNIRLHYIYNAYCSIYYIFETLCKILGPPKCADPMEKNWPRNTVVVEARLTYLGYRLVNTTRHRRALCPRVRNNRRRVCMVCILYRSVVAGSIVFLLGFYHGVQYLREISVLKSQSPLIATRSVLSALMTLLLSVWSYVTSNLSIL